MDFVNNYKVFFLLLCLPFLLFTLTSEQETNVRFPRPTEKEIEEGEKDIEQLGKAEVFSLSYVELYEFIVDRYWKGLAQDFHYYNANPTSLSPEQAKKPATILLHAYASNQGEWIPFLQWFDDYNKLASESEQSGPIFTLNYRENSGQADLIKKIEEIKQLYAKAGKADVQLNLVGHSLGSIVAAKYAYDPSEWVEGTNVAKVVSIAGRLKNMEPPINTPHYAYAYCLLIKLDDLWKTIEERRGTVHLYAVAAENDWLVPMESSLLGDDEQSDYVAPNTGHVLVARDKNTAKKIISWLFQK